MDRNKVIEVKDLVSHVSGMYKGMEVIEIFNNGNTVKCLAGGCQLVFPISSVVLERKHAEDEIRRVKRIYLSGPISGRDLDERRKAFSIVKERLKGKGYDVVNPMENGLQADADTHEHMRRDVELILTCDCIYMMRKWLHSKGCKLEFDLATAIGLSVIFEELNDENIKFS